MPSPIDLWQVIVDLKNRVGILERRPISAGGGGTVTSVNGNPGPAVVLGAADVGADPVDSAATAESNANTYTDGVAAAVEAHTIGDGTYLTGGGPLSSDPVLDLDFAAMMEALMDYLGSGGGFIQGSNMILTYTDGGGTYGTIEFESTGGSSSTGLDPFLLMGA